MTAIKQVKTIVLILVILTFLVPGSLPGTPYRVKASPQTALDGHWIGTTSQGYPVEFDVNFGGNVVSPFKITYYLYNSPCGGYVSSEQINNYININNDQFTYSYYSFTFGQFISPTTASGNYSYSFYSGSYCGGYSVSVSWSAHLAVPPDSFGKTMPLNGATNQSINPTLNWLSAEGAASYEYCVGTSADTCNIVNWASAGTNTSATLSGLNGSSIYYWRVRARNADGTTDSDGGASWNFTTIPCYTLTVGVNPSSSGSLVANPAPNCNSGTQYTSGTNVSLTANPSSNYVFNSWGGDVSGSQNPKTLAIDASKNITVNFASADSMTWAKTYGGSALDYALAIIPTDEGGVVAAGRTASFGAGGTDIWVFQLDAAGNFVWQKTYGGSGNESASSIAPTSDGGYLVSGSTSSYGAGLDDAWILKLDAAGNLQWQKTYGGSDSELIPM